MNAQTSASAAESPSIAPEVPQSMYPERRAWLMYFIIASAIALLLSLFYIVKHRAFAFVDIGSDTFFQFLPLQIAEVRALHEWRLPSWSFSVGPGAYLGPVLDPIQSLAALLPQSWQLSARLPIYFLKLILGGAFFFAYLRLMFDLRLALFGALAYAFSSYAMVNGQWDGHGYEVAQFAAYLYLLESFLKRGGSWRAIAAGLVVASGHVFNLYTFALLSCFYAFAHLLLPAPQPRRQRLLRLTHAAALMMLGVLLLAPIQLPNVYYLLENPRVAGNYSAASAMLARIAHPNDIVTIGSEVAGFFGKDLLGAGSGYTGWGNYFEGPGFYVGILLLLCIPQLLAPAASRRERWLCLAGIGLIGIYIVSPAPRLLVNGFGFDTFRISTLWVSAGVVVLGLAGLHRAAFSGVWRGGILIAGVALAGAIGLIAWGTPRGIDVRQLTCVLCFVGIYSALLCANARSGKLYSTGSLQGTVLPLFCLELLLFAMPPMLGRTPVNADGTSQNGSYDDGTGQALKVLMEQDGTGEFFRIEKSYNSVFLCDSLAQDYPGIKSYFLHGSSLTRFVDSTGIDRPVASSANYFGSALNRRDVLDLMGVKYILAHGRELDNYPRVRFEFAVGTISVYRNMSYTGFAHLHDTLMDEDSAARLNVDQRNAELLRNAIVADPVALRRELDVLQSESGSLPAAPNATTHIRRISDIDLRGEIGSATAAVLIMSMPYDIGWSALLDDVPAGTFVGDFGLTALRIPPGAHTLRMTYRAPGTVLGYGLALSSLALLLALALGRRARLRKRLLA